MHGRGDHPDRRFDTRCRAPDPLGEHYVIDLVAGFALAEAIWRVAPRAEPAIRMIAAVVQRLEPQAG